MKNVLVMGATGAMGTYLVPELSRLGYCVTALSLDTETPEYENVTYITCNAKRIDVLEKLFAEKHYHAIIDFMIYSEDQFEERHKLLLDNTDHYFFLSSYRVYANEETPIKETSPRLLEASKDKEFLEKHAVEYGLYKAVKEDILRRSGYKNYTILRPTMIYSTRRYQLVGLEADVFLYRAQRGQTVVLPEIAMDLHACMTWSGDVAKLITRLMFNEKAYCEAFTVGSGESFTWRDVAEAYKRIVGLDYIVVPTEDYLKITGEKEYYKHVYDRFFDRAIDNTKILEATGLKREDFLPLEKGLELELAKVRDYNWRNSPANALMDEYLANRNK